MITIASDRALSCADVVAVAAGVPASLDPATARLLDRRRAEVVERVRATRVPAYGFNRGFGHNVDVAVPEPGLERLQLNLVRSHACGLGPPTPVPIVRATMLLRAASLARGHSAVRSAVVEQLLAMLSSGITPVVPAYGSVGASGDLAPLAHVALGLVGEGECHVAGREGTHPIAEALGAAGLAPIALEMKEGLALINGSQLATAYGILAHDRLSTLLDAACVATAITNQVWLGSDAPYDADLHALRPHPGALAVAARLRELLAGSPMRAAHADHDVDGEVQDPYSLRCAAQVLGAAWDLLDDARRTLEVEAASVTDNPLMLPDETGAHVRIVSGGHFHGMPVAVKLYHLVQAAAIVASLSRIRSSRYVDRARNKGLGDDCTWPGLDVAERATSSGMMIPEYVAAALLNDVWAAAMPSHLFSLSTNAGQEDHVSMSAPLAVRLWALLPRVAEVLAIELAYGSQAAAIRLASDTVPSKLGIGDRQLDATAAPREAYEEALRREVGDERFDVEVSAGRRIRWPESARRLSAPCERAVAAVRRHVPPVEADRSMASELSSLAEAVLAGEITT